MRRLTIVLTALLFVSLSTSASEYSADEKKETKASKKDSSIVKKGYNFGPLPAIAYDADKGFQIGAILNIYNFGDGSNYPNYNSKMYFEASWFTKGSMLFQVRYDNKTLIPGVRWSSCLRANIDKAYDFYGFNGYQSYYDYSRVGNGNMYGFSPFYRMKKYEFLFRSDFMGTIVPHFKWLASVFANYHDITSIDYDNVNKGKQESAKFPSGTPTLYDIYVQSGTIGESEKNGGFSSGVRLGLEYDSRDKEGAPSRGIWAEGHVTLAPKYISRNQYYRYSLTFRHYVPIVKNDVLTFAYRLNYEGTFGNNAPWYALPYMTVIGEKADYEGMGGFNSVRGIMRTRVFGLDMAAWNIEMRWRFVRFPLWNQNIALGLNAFCDGAMVTRGRDLSLLPSGLKLPDGYTVLLTGQKEIPHAAVGGGFRFIMNENFIVAVDYGMPTSNFDKNSPLYHQDGKGALYINLGYLF